MRSSSHARNAIPDTPRSVDGAPTAGTTHIVGAVSALPTADADALAAAVLRNEAARARAVSDVTRSVAHEFSNVVTAIKGYCGLLLHDPDASPEQRADVRAIETAVDRSATLMAQLIALSAPWPTASRTLDLNAFLRESVSPFDDVMPPNITLHVRPSPDCGAIHAEEARLRWAVRSLLRHACAAATMARGGSVTVETQSVPAFASCGCGQLVCETGPRVLLSVAARGAPPSDDRGASPAGAGPATVLLDGEAGSDVATVRALVSSWGGHACVERIDAGATAVLLYFPHASAEPDPAHPVPRS